MPGNTKLVKQYSAVGAELSTDIVRERTFNLRFGGSLHSSVYILPIAPFAYLQKANISASYLLMDETLGTVSLSQTPSANSLSLISQANMVGFCLL